MVNKGKGYNYVYFNRKKLKWNIINKAYITMEKEKLNLLAPFLKPSLELLNVAFVINLILDVNTPDAAKPARKDCNNKIILNKIIC